MGDWVKTVSGVDLEEDDGIWDGNLAFFLDWVFVRVVFLPFFFLPLDL